MGDLNLSAAACAWFLLGAFVLAGMAQTAWFATPLSRRFSFPIDGGATFRGSRLFGDNKTLRGFVVMVPACALAFAALGAGAPSALGLWPLSALEYAALGALAAVGFMVGELPNSFVKRQLDIAPGSARGGSIAPAVQFMVDRLDSGIGMLLVVSLAVPTPWLTWAVVLLIGPAIHWSFSVVMFRLGLKARAA